MGHKGRYTDGIQKKEGIPVKKVKEIWELRKDVPFRVSQCIYGTSAILTFYVIGQIAMHL